MSSQKWHNRFLDLAKFISGWSKDPSTKVGAVIVDKNKRIVSVGYNGFPKDVKDDNRLYDRESKYLIIIHAEINAILFANKSLDDCILYTYP
jgi:dCMP deaminase